MCNKLRHALVFVNIINFLCINIRRARFLAKNVMIFSVNLILGRENYAGHDDVTLMTL